MRRWINLSGTIAPNGLSNLWAPMWFIDRGQRLGRSYDSFESRWFGYKRAKDAVNAHKTRISRIAFPHAFGEITSLMRDDAGPQPERLVRDQGSDRRAGVRRSAARGAQEVP